jgi:protein-disulfide isomerase
MSQIVRPAQSFVTRLNRASLFLSLLSAAVLLTSAANGRAQFGGEPAKTQIHDTSALHPPAAARVAIVEFMDMECPRCAAENPTVKAASANYKIPLIRHDFLIPGHAWSPIAATNARWFDTMGKGDEYRDQVFANQSTFYNNAGLLNQFTAKFAASHHIAMPFAVDPQGKFLAAVNADTELGRRTGIDHTPTVFIVAASGTKGAPYTEVLNIDQDLYRIIDQALADTPATAGKAPVKKKVPTK